LNHVFGVHSGNILAWQAQALHKTNVPNGTHSGKNAGAALCVTRTKRSHSRGYVIQKMLCKPLRWLVLLDLYRAPQLSRRVKQALFLVGDHRPAHISML
jgi:hypothetical protein